MIVAVVAVVVLAAGGWFVMKMRADAAAAKAEAERVAAVAKAEEDRVNKLAARLRTTLAEHKVAWDGLENRLREAERRAADAKNEFRGFKDGPAWRKAELSAMAQRHDMFATWLNDHLVSHPAKVARAKAEQLLADKLADEAAGAMEEMHTATEELQSFIRERAARMLDGTASVTVESTPAGLKFVLTDPYGRMIEGVTPAKIDGLPLSSLHDPRTDGSEGDTEIPIGEFRVEPSVRFIRAGWPDVVKTGRTRLDGSSFSAVFPEGALAITAQLDGVPFTASNALGWSVTGKAPAQLTEVPPGKVTVTLSREGFKEVSGTAEVVAGKQASVALDQRSQLVEISVAAPNSKIFVNGKFVGYQKTSVADLPPGEHALQLEADGYKPFRTKFAIEQQATRLTMTYDFKELSVEKFTCGKCNGRGSSQLKKSCAVCNGTGRPYCTYCDSNGRRQYSYGIATCGVCNGTKRMNCEAAGCIIGSTYETVSCKDCAGDGRVSRLDLGK